MAAGISSELKNLKIVLTLNQTCGTFCLQRISCVAMSESGFLMAVCEKHKLGECSTVSHLSVGFLKF
jgi:hypothetical protein